jgi:3-dehydrotetronate 4-kinase
MNLTLGVIADDFTGATDVANNLVRAGMRVVQTIGVPGGEVGHAAHAISDVDAVVVALKSRTAPVEQAVAQSLEAARWLHAHGARQLYFKVCSTFDSTARGNIGPVTEALMQLTGARGVPVTPAFPEAGRTVFKGHLFVGDGLLSDSPMRHHPLTPMTDSNLVRVLQSQLSTERVGLVDHAVVARGPDAIEVRLEALRSAGQRIAIVDTVDNGALHRLAAACHAWPLVVAGSGLAIALPACWGFAPDGAAAALPAAQGHTAIVSGSCSAASNAQVAHFVEHGGAAFAVDPLALAAGEDVAGAALEWAATRLASGPVLVHATAAPDAVKRVQLELGAERAGALVEAALARVAQGLVERGVGRLVVAGGETSGACVQALRIEQLRIGPQIDPGVPWCHARLPDGRGLHLALKSGNFGGVDFFRRAFDA